MKLSIFSNCHDLDPHTYKNPKHWRQKVFTGMSKKIVICEQNVGYLILGNLISDSTGYPANSFAVHP